MLLLERLLAISLRRPGYQLTAFFFRKKLRTYLYPMNTNKRIDTYILNAQPFAQPILNHL